MMTGHETVETWRRSARTDRKRLVYWKSREEQEVFKVWDREGCWGNDFLHKLPEKGRYEISRIGKSGERRKGLGPNIKGRKPGEERMLELKPRVGVSTIIGTYSERLKLGSCAAWGKDEETNPHQRLTHSR